MPRFLRPVLCALLLALIAGATTARAHGTDLLPAQIVDTGTDYRIHLEPAVGQAEALSGSAPGTLKTWGDLKRLRPALAAGLCSGVELEGEPGGFTLRIPLLDGSLGLESGMPLPDRVPMILEKQRDAARPPRLVARDFLAAGTGAHVPISILQPRAPEQPPANAATSESRAPASSSAPRFGYFFLQGIAHILPGGADHVLFVLGLYLGTRRFRDVLLLLSLFTAAHAITLLWAVFGRHTIPPAVIGPVEFLIAASIAIVGVENMIRRPVAGLTPGRMTMITAFGLIHGIGFANALAAMPWPEQDGFVFAVIAVNAGIEIAQIGVVLTAMVLTSWAWKHDWYARRIATPASCVIALTALLWCAQRVL